MLRQHQWFVSFEVDVECYEVLSNGLVETYAKQILKDKSSIKASDEVVDVCKLVVQAIDGVQSNLFLIIRSVAGISIRK